MSTVWTTVVLDSLGVLRVRGADALAFLQGQLSADIALSGAERSLLAGYHNPQGRVIALLRVVQCAPQDFLAIVPRELAATVGARLTKFILRSKVQVTDESALWQIHGVIAPPADAAPPGAAWPATPNLATRIEDALVVCVAAAPARWLWISPAVAAPPSAALRGALSAPAGSWQRLMVAAGEPQIYAATSEEFVAQMLNLDVLGAIAFDKGCYTGQEVIARAHYRGRVKRRLQRFVTHAAAQLKPGDAGELADGRAFRVIECATRADGRCEFLAVAPLAAGDSASPTAHGATHRDTNVISAEQLALPYALPG